MPITQGVFFNFAPFNNNCLADKGIVISSPSLNLNFIILLNKYKS